MMAEEVIPPLLSVEEANAPDEPDSDCVEKQEKQMETHLWTNKSRP